MKFKIPSIHVSSARRHQQPSHEFIIQKREKLSYINAVQPNLYKNDRQYYQYATDAPPSILSKMAPCLKYWHMSDN